MPLICPDTNAILTPAQAAWCWAHGYTVQLLSEKVISEIVIPGLVFGNHGHEQMYETGRLGRWNGWLRITTKGKVKRVLLDY